MSLDDRDKDWIVSDVLKPVLNEMGIRFSEVNQRLDRIDATLVSHGKQLSILATMMTTTSYWLRSNGNWREL